MLDGATMESNAKLVLIVVGICQVAVVFSQGQESSPIISFPSGIRYETVTPDEGKTSKDAYLFDGSGDVQNKKLSLSFKVSAFKHASQDLFRADPVLFKCVQKVQNAMQKDGERLEIVSGYVPASAISTTAHHDVYQSTGMAVRVQIRTQGSPGNLNKNDLIKAVGKSCVPLFEQINRDIGVADLGAHIQIHIQGPEENGPYYNPSSIENIVQQGIDAAYDLSGVAMCHPASSPSVPAGGLFPFDVDTVEKAVGGLEEPITRDNAEDFGKLAQYPASHIVFEDTESSSSWCGQVGNPCQDCKAKIAGSTLNLRCADRTMSYRLMRFLRSLGKAVSLEWPGAKLRVTEAWDEAHQSSSSGDNAEGSLHYEGRAAKVNANDGDASKLERLSQLAICAGIDAVQRNADHLLLAVVKQKGAEARTVTFADNQELVEVEAPAAKAHMYKLRDEFSDTEAKEYPLFDGADRHELKLSQDVTLGMFVPHDGRYLRLSPNIVSCFQSIILAEQKRGANQTLQVCRSYYNRMETDSEIDVFDKRFISSGLGVSMELSFDCSKISKEPIDLYDQMQLIIEQCSPIFYNTGKSMGIGLYNRFISVEIRPRFKAWAATPELREESTEQEFSDYYKRWHNRAIEGRVVDPDDYQEACLASTQPFKQDVGFVHKDPEKTFGPDENDPQRCVPQGNTGFCTSTQKHRNAEFDRIWTEVQRKHLYHDKDEVRDALKLCVGTLETCGTCQEGVYWDKKVRNCNNFLHWVPFEFLNNVDDVSLYLQESFDLKQYACAGHCLNKSPLFSLMVPTMEKLYRPREDESIQERLYTQTNNPSPVMELMHRIYAMSAKGIVKVWVVNEVELITLKDPLKYVCLYNKAVTKVEIYVGQSSNKEIVTGQMQTFYSEWSKQGCLDYARKFLPPFSVADLPPHMSKRSAEFDLREQMLHHHRTWEDRWLNGHPLI